VVGEPSLRIVDQPTRKVINTEGFHPRYIESSLTAAFKQTRARITN
jgi:hypothetical protein